MNDTQFQIAKVCDSIKELLLDKNKKYGDSAVNPLRIFSAASPVEQIKVRIDDKLSRISKGSGLLGTDEDVVMDLIGYLILLKICMDREKDSLPKGQAWDGTDISEFISTVNYDKGPSYRDLISRYNDPNAKELVELHTSGDKFA